MVSVEKIIELVQPIKVIGDTNKSIANALQLTPANANPTALMWVSAKNIGKLHNIATGVILCPSESNEDFCLHDDCTYLICNNPRLAFQKVLTTFFVPPRDIGICPTAVIAPSVKLGKAVYIGHHVVIESNCVIGNRTSIGHNTVIKKETIIGDDVVIGSNNSIGGVGFGYEKDETGEYVVIPHLGNVVIKDRVEIGNNTCIDRGVLGATLIGENTKIDNLVHVAHGVKIGKNSLVIANALVGGSTEIGENVWVAPSATILNGINVGNHAVIGLGAVVLKPVASHSIVVGNPAKVLDKKK